MSIQHWPEGERPREKLLARGADSLSDAELLAILLRTGIRGKSAVDVARELLAGAGSLGALLNTPCAQLARQPGLGLAKAAQLQAALTLARRCLDEDMRLADVLSSPQAVRDYLRLTIGPRDVEVFVLLLLSAQNHVLAVEEVFQGTLTETRVYPREVVRRALAHNASAVIVAHNHPSGVGEPSAADVALTATLKSALELVDIRLLDHFVVTRSQTLSLAEAGML